jgi:hypothetical protein
MKHQPKEKQPMSNQPVSKEAAPVHPNPEKDPSDWVTGAEPMTGPQMSYLKTLSQEANEPFDETLNKAQASERIEELQKLTGRGRQGQETPSK